MNIKRYLLASLVAAVVITIVEMVGHGYFMTPYYKETESLWRTYEAMNKLIWMGYVATVITSLIFAYIYHKGYEGKGPGALEGLRFGIIAGLFVAVPMALWSYVSQPITTAVAVGWFLIPMVKFALAGIGVGLVYKN